MRRLAFAALCGLAIVLASALGLEIALPGPGQDDMADATGIRPAPRLPRLDSARATAQVVDHTDEWVATILGRPLFSRDRRPSGERVAAAAAGESLPRLTGIAVSPLGRSAIFAGDPGGKPRVVGEGGSIAGFTVRTIAPDAVQVMGPGGARTLSPTFDPTPPKSATSPPLPSDAAQPYRFQPGRPLPGTLPGPLTLPGRPRFGDGASLAPSRFGRDLSDAVASQPQIIDAPQ